MSFPDVSFKKTDFPKGLGTQGDLDKLFLPLNSALQAARTALNGGLTFGLNFNAELKTATVTVPASTTAAPVLPSCFPFSISTRITNTVGILVLAVFDKSPTPGVPALGNLSWTQTKSGQIRVDNLPGLLQGRTYQITLLFLGG